MRSRFDWVNRCFVILFLTEILSGSSVALQAQKSDSSTKEFALVGARIYPAPGAKPIVNGVIVVAGGKIVSVGEASTLQVPRGMRTIGCSGKILVAGLWNAHVHFMEPKWDHAADLPAPRLTTQLQDMLTGYGFTSVVDLSLIHI